MADIKKELLVVRPENRFSVCVDYIFRIFGRAYGYECRFAPSLDGSPETSQPVIYYGEPQAITADAADQASPRATLRIFSSAFFSEEPSVGFGNPVMPADLGKLVQAARGNAFTENIVRTSAHSALLESDLVASAFYFLSGYHDWAFSQRDQHGRVLAAHIDLPKETWQIPVVNHWFRQLAQLLQMLETGADTPEIPSLDPHVRQTICLTHDVDFLRKYRSGRLGRRLVKSLANPKEFPAAFKDFRRSLSSDLPDPYDSFDALYAIKERVSAPSTFFFLGSDPGGRNGDYALTDRPVRELFTRARTYGDEIALHGSWDSVSDCKRLDQEKQALEEAARTTIRGSRQHYLRFATPETWQCGVAAGLRYEATGGFPDQSGFKYGWSGCFQPFDLDAMQPLPLLALPLVCMDVTLARYEKIPAELALENLSSLLDAACDGIPGGAFVFLWHNIMADQDVFPGYWSTFEYFFSVASGSARFVTCSQLCDEYGPLD